MVTKRLPRIIGTGSFLLTVSILFSAALSFAGEPSLQENLFLKNRGLPDTDNIARHSQIMYQIPKTSSAQTRDAKPFLKSLFIPGWGQYSQDRKGMALLFVGMETVFWGGMIGVKTYGNWLEGDYKAYAVSHASIDPNDKDHDFFVDLGNYDSRDEFNETQQLERDWDSLYLGSEFNWEWDSSANRTTFENLRIKSDLYKNSVVYFAGAIVINHIASALDAARHSRIQDNLQAGVTFNSNGNSMLTIIKGI